MEAPVFDGGSVVSSAFSDVRRRHVLATSLFPLWSCPHSHCPLIVARWARLRSAESTRAPLLGPRGRRAHRRVHFHSLDAYVWGQCLLDSRWLFHIGNSRAPVEINVGSTLRADSVIA